MTEGKTGVTGEHRQQRAPENTNNQSPKQIQAPTATRTRTPLQHWWQRLAGKADVLFHTPDVGAGQ